MQSLTQPETYPWKPQASSPADTLHEMFEAQAARTPGATAVLQEDAALTYAQLNRLANRLARFLQMRGVGRDTRVALCAESGPEMIVAMLAVLKAGGAHAPLDPAYPAARLQFLLDDLAPTLVLTLSCWQESLPEDWPRQAICLDTDHSLWSGQPAGNLHLSVHADDLAYVIYTSGSTGQPKGVLLPHRGAVNNLHWRQETWSLSAEDRMLQAYSFSFDPSVWAVFWPLIAGARLVLPRRGGISDAGYLAQTLADAQITVVGFGPAMLRALLALPDMRRCSSLRHLFCGGEALPPDLPALVHSLLRADLHNVYGPTEATIDAACWTVPRGFRGDSVPIGYPLPNTELLLRDLSGQRVPDGAEGELCITGVSLARGYWNRPELTAERFPPCPSDPASGERLYRTGDLARRGPDGAYHFLGRMDGQVQLRGLRIETGEIEAALCRRPDIQDALVVLREEEPGSARLVAYLVAGPAALTPQAADLRDYLCERMPAPLVPAVFVFLRELPLTASGKRDRLALPPPPGERAAREDFLPPQTPLQHQLAQIWEDLLAVRPIGIRDRFWDLGGHSLLAARLLDQIARSCGRDLPLSALYENSTIEALADSLQQGDASVPASPLAMIAPGGDRPPFFYLYGFHPLGGFYCYPLARRLSPEQPFYALHPPPGKPRRVEQMAEDYCRAIRAVQPQGPYRLGGFCGSALVAYEMARQFRATGETVEFLALIEAHAVNPRLRLILRRWAGRTSRFQVWQRAVLPLFAALQSRWRIARGRGEDAEIEACDRAAAAYVPGFYDNPVYLFRAAHDPEPLPADPCALWREVAPGTEVYDIPGTHLSCLLDHVGALGDRLSACLAVLDTQAAKP